jgi:preprotein translocase subunit YajC
MIFDIFHFESFASILFAMGAPAQPGEDPTKSLIQMAGPFVIIMVIFYLIAIRPQQKQQKELKKMLDALKVGDRVLTTGGIFGVVSHIKEKSVTVKIAEGTKVEMLRSGVQQVLSDEVKEVKEEKKS